MKQIVLDVGDVLISLNREKKNEVIYRYQKQNSVEIVGYGDVPDQLINEYGTGRITSEKYVDALSSLLKVPRSVVVEAEDSIFANVNIQLLEFLGTRKESDRLHILSNTQDLHWQRVKALLPMDMFHSTYPSHEIGFRKPSPEVYNYIAEQLGGSTSDILFLDDEPENVRAAICARWRNSLLHKSNLTSISWLAERLNE